MQSITGKGDAGVSALEPSRRFPRGVVLTLAVLLFIGLFFSRPTAKQFAQHVWVPALAGMKQSLHERENKDVLVALVKDFLAKRFPRALQAIEAGDYTNLDGLPNFWMEHTSIYDWKIVTYFRYDEATCFSDYLGVAGRLVNLQDGCEVEPYRAKGGSL